MNIQISKRWGLWTPDYQLKAPLVKIKLQTVGLHCLFYCLCQWYLVMDAFLLKLNGCFCLCWVGPSFPDFIISFQKVNYAKVGRLVIFPSVREYNYLTHKKYIMFLKYLLFVPVILFIF